MVRLMSDDEAVVPDDELMVPHDEALVPHTDRPNDTPETIARRARLQARMADERSRRALIVADDVRKNSWTRDQHRRFASELVKSWRQYRRVIVTLILICLAMMAGGLYVLGVILNGTDDRAEETRQRLDELAMRAYQHCVTRNAQLNVQQVLYSSLVQSVRAEDPTSPQIPVLRTALDNLPDPLNCDEYTTPAPQPQQK